MIAEAVDYVQMIDQLPHQGTLMLYDVPWDEYEDLIVQMESRPGCRLTYNNGVLKIMSPRSDHEYPKDVILRLVSVYAEEFDIMLESYGSTTYRARKKAMGAEPDTSFYVQNAPQMIACRDINLEKDPPPDVVVEVDTTNESMDKLEIYAALAVPEVWRFDGQRFRILLLSENRYSETENSVALPLITGEILTEYLDRGKKEGQTAMLKSFRQFLNSHK